MLKNFLKGATYLFNHDLNIDLTEEAKYSKSPEELTKKAWLMTGEMIKGAIDEYKTEKKL